MNIPNTMIILQLIAETNAPVSCFPSFEQTSNVPIVWLIARKAKQWSVGTSGRNGNEKKPDSNGRKNRTRNMLKYTLKSTIYGVKREFISDIGQFKLKCYISFSPNVCFLECMRNLVPLLVNFYSGCPRWLRTQKMNTTQLTE